LFTFQPCRTNPDEIRLPSDAPLPDNTQPRDLWTAAVFCLRDFYDDFNPITIVHHIQRRFTFEWTLTY
jgi:hypothetical protein